MKLTLNLGNMRSSAVAIVAGVLLLAGYSQRSEAQVLPCADGTFEALIAGGPCTIGDKTFSNFLASGDVADDKIIVTAINGVLGGPPLAQEKQWGFNFQFNLFASGKTDPTDETVPDQSHDLEISYTVACTNGSACIDSIHSQIVGSFYSETDPETGDVDYFGAFLSLGENYSGGSNDDFELTLIESGTSSYDADFTTPVSFLNIIKDFNATCSGIGALGEPDDRCFASLSVNVNTVDQINGGNPPIDTVPEPASLLLLAAGLLGLGWSRRSRRNQV